MSGRTETNRNIGLTRLELPGRSYTSLFRKFILASVTCSVIPLLIVGWAGQLYYFRFSLFRAADYFQRNVEYNRIIVQTFVRERISDLKLLAFTHSLGFLTDSSNLREAFNILNQDGYYFTDLGVIDDVGKHMAYVGPYDLMDKDYSSTSWFKEVMEKGAYVSDMFMAYRGAPHFIMAIRCSTGKTNWILRGTIDNEFLSSLVEARRLGRTGEIFLVNRQGVYQTMPRFNGKIMDAARLPINSFSSESGLGFIDTRLPSDRLLPLNNLGLTDLIKHSLMRSNSLEVVGYSRLSIPEWSLVAKQSYSEVFGDITRVNTAILIILHSSIFAILIISILAARYMIKAIKKRDEKAALLDRQLTQAGKLASIGELAAGVAHEINNPLAIILTENEIMRDLTEDEPTIDVGLKNELSKSLSRVDAQVERCSHITHNMLRLSRKISASAHFVDLNLVLGEVVGLLEKQAKTSGVQISLDFQDNLPPVYTDPFELEQVFLNLINNAIDAHEGKSDGRILITTRFKSYSWGLVVTVSDTGCGMTAEVIERIFDPFFTTKPVGKGTGLGLSISYNIIAHMGGNISVRSEVGKGSEFIVFLPCRVSEQRYRAQASGKEEQDEQAQTSLSGR